jgi:hypothetical protein
VDSIPNSPLQNPVCATTVLVRENHRDIAPPFNPNLILINSHVLAVRVHFLQSFEEVSPCYDIGCLSFLNSDRTNRI